MNIFYGAALAKSSVLFSLPNGIVANIQPPKLNWAGFKDPN
jgi:hypothetical protein